MYTEGIAGKGGNDVCSMVYDYIKNNTTLKNLKELHLFSDGCCGQNKNHSMLRMCAVLKEQSPSTVIQSYFPCRGHSFLPCDTVFGQIKQKFKEQDRYYCPRDYLELMCAVKNVEVQCVTKESEIFLNFDKWWPNYYIKSPSALESSRLPAAQKTKLQPTKFMQYIFQKDNIIRALKTINSEDMFSFRVKKTAVKETVLMPTEPAYEGFRAVNIKKIDDVMKLKQYVPMVDEHCRKFWQEVETYPTTTKETGSTNGD